MVRERPPLRPILGLGWTFGDSDFYQKLILTLFAGRRKQFTPQLPQIEDVANLLSFARGPGMNTSTPSSCRL
jgi:hypothetical protein